MCICKKFCETDLIPMSIDCMEVWENFYSFLEDRIYPGDERWWVSSMKCKDCGTDWLIGQDERIHDNFCIRRLTIQESILLREKGIWPSYFDSYEALLDLALIDRNVYSFDYYDHPDHGIQDTISGILKKNPKITRQRLGELFNLDLDTLQLYFK